MPTITAKPCSALIASSRLLNGSVKTDFDYDASGGRR
jgi:hypothetical protein